MLLEHSSSLSSLLLLLLTSQPIQLYHLISRDWQKGCSLHTDCNSPIKSIYRRLPKTEEKSPHPRKISAPYSHRAGCFLVAESRLLQTGTTIAARTNVFMRCQNPSHSRFDPQKASSTTSNSLPPGFSISTTMPAAHLTNCLDYQNHSKGPEKWIKG